jgi:hypothetical protein
MLELEAQKKDVAARITIHQATRPRIDRDRVEFFLHSFRIGDPASTDYRRRVISSLIDRVTITDLPTPDGTPTHRRLDLVYNLTEHRTSTASLCSDTGGNPPRNPPHPNTIYIIDGQLRMWTTIEAPI